MAKADFNVDGMTFVDQRCKELNLLHASSAIITTIMFKNFIIKKSTEIIMEKAPAELLLNITLHPTGFGIALIMLVAVICAGASNLLVEFASKQNRYSLNFVLQKLNETEINVFKLKIYDTRYNLIQPRVGNLSVTYKPVWGIGFLVSIITLFAIGNLS